MLSSVSLFHISCHSLLTSTIGECSRGSLWLVKGFTLCLWPVLLSFSFTRLSFFQWWLFFCSPVFLQYLHISCVGVCFSEEKIASTNQLWKDIVFWLSFFTYVYTTVQKFESARFFFLSAGMHIIDQKWQHIHAYTHILNFLFIK